MKNNTVHNTDPNKPRNYSYSTFLIKLLLTIKLKTSTSFRALSISASIFVEFNILASKAPSHTTLINWIHKIGYHELTKQKNKAHDWIIIIDESIQLGQDKILLIYGIREKNIDFNKPLQCNNLMTLRILRKNKWTGEIIKDILSDLELEIGKIKYAVADFGSDIRKGLRLQKIPHVHDLTHKIALIIEKIYKNDPAYIEITSEMSKMRIKYSQTQLAHTIPPKQRKKSRYQNIKTISDWCVNSLNYIEKNVNKNESDKLEWLVKHKKNIKELALINKVICDIEKLLKYYGLSAKTIKKTFSILNQLKTKKATILKVELKEYFKNTLKQMNNCKKILITSDIIESAFGKYKNYVSSNPMAGVTNLVLTLAAFTYSFDSNSLENILEKIKVEDIKKWTKKNIGKTLLQKRKALLSGV